MGSGSSGLKRRCERGCESLGERVGIRSSRSAEKIIYNRWLVPSPFSTLSIHVTVRPRQAGVAARILNIIDTHIRPRIL
jgi:hypothetical protein